MSQEKVTAERYGHPIQVVARRTGLTPDVIRAWEKRYNAVMPARSSTNRRLYSDADVERLLLLHRATLGGRTIGQVAHHSSEELLQMVREDEATSALAHLTVSSPKGDSTAHTHLAACLAAVERLDWRALESALMNGTVEMSRPVLLDQLMVPLMQQMGQLWSEGALRIVHEHMASAVVRTFLGQMRNGAATAGWTPAVITTTPAGQGHEFGALIASATAASEGWRVTYLGPNLPAEEIAVASQQEGTRAVLLSIVYPPDDPLLAGELRKLRQFVSEGVTLIIGGRVAHAYGAVIEEIGAVRLPDMQALRRQLGALRF